MPKYRIKIEQTNRNIKTIDNTGQLKQPTGKALNSVKKKFNHHKYNRFEGGGIEKTVIIGTYLG